MCLPTGLAKTPRARRCLVDHLVCLVVYILVYRGKHFPQQNALQSWICNMGNSPTTGLLSGALGFQKHWPCPLFIYFFASFLSSSPPYFFFLFSLSFLRVGNWGLERARWSWLILAPNQPLADLPVNHCPVHWLTRPHERGLRSKLL